VVVVDVVTAVGDDQAERGLPGEIDADALGRGRTGHHAGVEQLGRVTEDLEHHGAVRADLVVDADLRR